VIGSLRGKLVQKNPPHLMVDVQGVGYEIEAPASTWSALPELGADVQLRTHLLVREDHHSLFGFLTDAERSLFRDLLRVNGIGAKSALAVLSAMSVQGCVSAIQAEDAATLTRVPGIGRKTAERIILDLRDRLGHIAPVTMPERGAASDAGASAANEVFNALVALGYKPVEARRMLEQVSGKGSDAAEILRAALRNAAAHV
jgi:Holliday junction DNA helicase RuvA